MRETTSHSRKSHASMITGTGSGPRPMNERDPPPGAQVIFPVGVNRSASGQPKNHNRTLRRARPPSSDFPIMGICMDVGIDFHAAEGYSRASTSAVSAMFRSTFTAAIMPSRAVGEEETPWTSSLSKKSSNGAKPFSKASAAKLPPYSTKGSGPVRSWTGPCRTKSSRSSCSALSTCCPT